MGVELSHRSTGRMTPMSRGFTRMAVLLIRRSRGQRVTASEAAQNALVPYMAMTVSVLCQYILDTACGINKRSLLLQESQLILQSHGHYRDTIQTTWLPSLFTNVHSSPHAPPSLVISATY
ncbi:hypothetical protein J6590_048920 [Homalodisca vitripennis]|nr:hypothetical protein J6590_048920 [Homalodisca vitripennis]